MSKDDLLERGCQLMVTWCRVNLVNPPLVRVIRAGKPTFGVCAYYRDGVIRIWPRYCAAIGRAGRMWSYPGYKVDRTPYGVLQHELAHHVDGAHGHSGGAYGREWRAATKEKPLTGYCPNDNEWFAEMFRLYVTNPDLLRLLRPRTWELMLAKWTAVEHRKWDEVLAGAERQLGVVRRQVAT